ELEVFAAEHGLKIGSIADLIRHRLSTEKTVQRIDEREVETSFGRFRLMTYRDVLSRELHFALVRGTPGADRPTLVRVQAKSLLSDVLQLRRDDLGMPLADAIRRIADEPEGVVVVLAEQNEPESLLARLTQSGEPAPSGMDGWRRNGVGAQILADL